MQAIHIYANLLFNFLVLSPEVIIANGDPNGIDTNHEGIKYKLSAVSAR
jgi:hypothetical protein